MAITPFCCSNLNCRISTDVRAFCSVNYSEDEWSDDSQPKNLHHMSDFDVCRLVEIAEKCNAECILCRKVKNKKIKTNLMCFGCDLICCPQCYDSHRREKLLLTIRAFKRSNPLTQLKVSKCGNFLESDPFSDINYHESSKQDNHSMLSSSVEYSLQNKSRSAPEEFSLYSLGHTCESSSLQEDVTELTFNSVKPAITLLKENYAVISELMFDGEGKFKCMYFQDSQMKDFFNFYSQRICIDVSCRLVSLDVILYLFLAEDSDGQSNIISVALVSVENMENLTWLLTMFKKHNPSWRSVKMVVVDSLIRNRDVVKSCFPDAHLMMCFYHATRAFKQDMDTYSELSDVPCEQKKIATELFESMVLAFSEMEYTLFYQQMQSLHSNVFEYFEKQWSPVRSEWRIRIECYEGILYSLNSFLSFIEKTLKPVLSSSPSLCIFIKKLFFAIKLLRTERKHKISTTVQSVQLSLYSKFTPQFQIAKILTHYAAEFVNQQLDISAEINITPGILLDSYIFCHFGVTIVANSSTCSCKIFMLTSLPCCHIFAVRRALCLPIFDETMCDNRWFKKYHFEAYTSLYDKCNNSSQLEDGDIFEIGPKLVNQLVPAVVKYSNLHGNRITLLNQLVIAWQKGETVLLQFDGREEPENITICPSVPISNLAVENSVIKKEFVHPDEQPQLTLCSETGVLIEEKKCSKPEFLINDCAFGNRTFEGRHINFVYITCVICKTRETCIRWMQHMQFLQSSMPCPSCGNEMDRKSATRLSDGIIWICRSGSKTGKKSCSKRCSMRRGTWFEGTNMSLEQILLFTYMWIHGFTQRQILSELGISSATFTVWDKFFRRICTSCSHKTKADDSKKEDNAAAAYVLNDVQDYDTNYEPAGALWHRRHSGQDLFIAFLSDAKALYQKDNAYSSV